ncbi:hypothetical protein GV819_20205 [Pseudomonas sp. Fl5BN2]|uniref:hypothetical protein n=1 Tax=Pseudomonas sp. Fl5BN2 TaxID=2697652 RepID=UPI0013783CFF|nr:hypothetical protein [Pseudomonas sp. Fl5BN2]NBF04608.1 hypothetical protein [Pseudomonas sp. Fl5BN2]
MRTAAKLKVNFIMKIARKDRRFMNDLSKDPVRTLLESGIDLSPGELFAVIDVIKGTKASPLGPHLMDLRTEWDNAVADSKI